MLSWLSLVYRGVVGCSIYSCVCEKKKSVGKERGQRLNYKKLERGSENICQSLVYLASAGAAAGPHVRCSFTQLVSGLRGQ